MPGDTKYRTKWTEEETILVFYYYCQIPFGKINQHNSQIVQIANLLGRTPGSISFKMGNLAHFDPSLQSRNINGLKNASKLDEEIVKRFLDNWEELSFQAKQIEEKLKHASSIPEKEGNKHMDINESLPEGNDQVIATKQRINQTFFRYAVLSSYSNRCCITGISLPSLLIASHIKPWVVSDPKTERTNPSNGLCLNALHDKAFDRGLITILPDYTVRVSKQLKKLKGNEGTDWLLMCDKQTIILPEKFLPDKKFIEYHNDMIFEKIIV